jgi:hypothetical protein
MRQEERQSLLHVSCEITSYTVQGSIETQKLHTFVSELIYVSCINYTTGLLRIQTLPGKAKQTFANFSSNFHPNLIQYNKLYLTRVTPIYNIVKKCTSK